MARSICHFADERDAGKRLDVVLAERGWYSSRSSATRAIEGGRVLVGGNPVQKRTIVKAGDAIYCELDEEPGDCKLMGEPIPLDIRYEDDDLIVLSKQPGLICHPSADHRESTLVNALIHHCGREHLCNVQGEDDRLGIVHRLDGDTSGLMLAAKTDEAGRVLMDAIALKDVERKYLCLVHGIIDQQTGMIDAPIMRNPKDRTQMAVGEGASSREAITTFEVIERFESSAHDNGYTLLSCKLYTGRTHQIRVHLQFIKHPVVGDQTYTTHSPRSGCASLGLDRQFLHSYALAFEHPCHDETLSFTDHLYPDLARALETIEERGCGVTEAYADSYQFLKGWS